jgi:hypothetical protein
MCRTWRCERWPQEITGIIISQGNICSTLYNNYTDSCNEVVKIEFLNQQVIYNLIKYLQNKLPLD